MITEKTFKIIDATIDNLKVEIFYFGRIRAYSVYVDDVCIGSYLGFDEAFEDYNKKVKEETLLYLAKIKGSEERFLK